MTDFKNDFSLENILRITKQNETKECDIINYHYKKVVYKIKDRYSNYYDHLYYEVDSIVPSLPLYNANEIAEKLVEFMTEKEFKCKVIYQNRLFFWWNPKKRESPHIPEILKILYEKIKQAATNNNEILLYEVPMVLAGFPWYDSNDAAVIIGNKLIKKGFIVKVVKSFVYVSWKKEEIENKTNLKIKFKSNNELKRQALQKINYINEQRYVDFVNPKRVRDSHSAFGSSISPSSVSKSVSNSVSTSKKSSRGNEEFLYGLSSLSSDVNNILNKHK